MKKQTSDITLKVVNIMCCMCCATNSAMQEDMII